MMILIKVAIGTVIVLYFIYVYVLPVSLARLYTDISEERLAKSENQVVVYLVM